MIRLTGAGERTAIWKRPKVKRNIQGTEDALTKDSEKMSRRSPSAKVDQTTFGGEIRVERERIWLTRLLGFFKEIAPSQRKHLRRGNSCQRSHFFTSAAMPRSPVGSTRWWRKHQYRSWIDLHVRASTVSVSPAYSTAGLVKKSSE